MSLRRPLLPPSLLSPNHWGRRKKRGRECDKEKERTARKFFFQLSVVPEEKKRKREILILCNNDYKMATFGVDSNFSEREKSRVGHWSIFFSFFFQLLLGSQSLEGWGGERGGGEKGNFPPPARPRAVVEYFSLESETKAT